MRDRLNSTKIMLFIIRSLRNEQNAETADAFEKVLIDREMRDLEICTQLEDMDKWIKDICQTQY